MKPKNNITDPSHPEFDDAPELEAKDIARMRPLKDVHPELAKSARDGTLKGHLKDSTG